MSVAPAGRHGGDAARVAASLGLDVSQVLDLSASLNPVAPDPGPVVSKHLDSLGRYPDPEEATRELAATIGLEPGRLLLTNGGAEAIALVAEDLGRAWAEECDFALYRRHIRLLDPGGPRIRSNPHNPTGLLATASERAAVWDEAFFPLATGRWTRGDDATVVGSLTKVFASPGLRLGYILSDEATIERLAARQPQWSVNGLALASLPDFLDSADLPGWAAGIARLRADLTSLLSAHGLDPQPSDANYVLCAGAAGLRERLAPLGVVVRDCASFGLAGSARVAVPDEPGLERLALALEALS